MAMCEVCGNEYRMAFEVRVAGAVHVCDSLGCAAQRIAPICENCGCRILGHGLETEEGRFYCCGHCARVQGADQLVDHG